MYARQLLPEIERQLFKGKAIIVYGARQVGKTTLVQALLAKHGADSLYLNCDEPDIRARLTDTTSTRLRQLVGKRSLVVIDEAQRVPNIGLTLKLLTDQFPGQQVVATGSSSLDLANTISEPLTGRKFEFHLHPLSLQELATVHSPLEIERLLEHYLVTGLYPEIVCHPTEAERRLDELSSSYLYKDILQYQHLRRPELLEKLLVALALQIGSEASFSELAKLLCVTKETVATYVRLLEQAFVIFSLRPFSRNKRNELVKMRKIYFYDLGIRNALIRNFNPLSLRQDTGALWENFLILERLKYNQARKRNPATYFWRTHQQQEIDYLEEQNGQLAAFEFTWTRLGKKRIPQPFFDAYPGSSGEIISRQNALEFLGISP